MTPKYKFNGCWSTGILCSSFLTVSEVEIFARMWSFSCKAVSLCRVAGEPYLMWWIDSLTGGCANVICLKKKKKKKKGSGSLFWFKCRIVENGQTAYFASSRYLFSFYVSQMQYHSHVYTSRQFQPLFSCSQQLHKSYLSKRKSLKSTSQHCPMSTEDKLSSSSFFTACLDTVQHSIMALKVNVLASQ